MDNEIGIMIMTTHAIGVFIMFAFVSTRDGSLFFKLKEGFGFRPTMPNGLFSIYLSYFWFVTVFKVVKITRNKNI